MITAGQLTTSVCHLLLSPPLLHSPPRCPIDTHPVTADSPHSPVSSQGLVTHTHPAASSSLLCMYVCTGVLRAFLYILSSGLFSRLPQLPSPQPWPLYSLPPPPPPALAPFPFSHVFPTLSIPLKPVFRPLEAFASFLASAHAHFHMNIHT